MVETAKSLKQPYQLLTGAVVVADQPGLVSFEIETPSSPSYQTLTLYR